jgi:hypothetical protein
MRGIPKNKDDSESDEHGFFSSISFVKLLCGNFSTTLIKQNLSACKSGKQKTKMTTSKSHKSDEHGFFSSAPFCHSIMRPFYYDIDLTQTKSGGRL